MEDAVKEFAIIEELRSRSRPVDGVTLGIGDDTAILEPGRFDLITVDTIVEGVHFRRDWSSPEAIGWKLLACNLSDIAAMGGAPGPYLVAMAIGPAVDHAWIEGVFRGMEAAAEAFVPAGFETGLIGGDTTQTSGPTVLSLTLLGEAAPAGAVLRSGATPGDRICLIGGVGESVAGLRLLEHFEATGRSLDTAEEHHARLINAHRYPAAMVKEGALLGLHGLANALIDVSDGLAQDLGHILRASRVGARVESHRLPLSSDARRAASELGASVVDWGLSGGEDYALVCTVSPDRAAQIFELAEEHGFEVRDIGEIREEREGFRIVDASGLDVSPSSRGYEHRFGRDIGSGES